MLNSADEQIQRCKECLKPRPLKWFSKSRDGRCFKCVLGPKKKQRAGHDSRRAAKLRAEILTMLGGKCNRCGFSDWRALQIGHTLGGGTKEKRQFAHPNGSVNRVKYYRHVRENIHSGLYEALCANCNWIQRFEAHEAGSKYHEQVTMKRTRHGIPRAEIQRRFCKNCKKDISEMRSGAKFCSAKCNKEWAYHVGYTWYKPKEKVPLICAGCGQPSTGIKGQKYCSPRCRLSWRGGTRSKSKGLTKEAEADKVIAP